MTAEDKAKELVDRFYSLMASNVFYEVVEPNQIQTIPYFKAKQCALICVDEILDVIFEHHKIQYWKEVKQEIDKL